MLLSGINKIFLLGEIYNMPVCFECPGMFKEYRFTLSTKEFVPKKDSGVEHVEYHLIKVFEDCITAGRLLAAGQIVHIEGKIQTYSSIEVGIKRYQTNILATRLHHI